MTLFLSERKRGLHCIVLKHPNTAKSVFTWLTHTESPNGLERNSILLSVLQKERQQKKIGGNLKRFTRV